MNGTRPEIRNQTKNELPLIRPMVPPARPKKNMITIRPMDSMGLDLPEDSLQRPENRDHDHDHQGGPDDRLDDADRDPDRERCCPDQNQARHCPAEDRRASA